MKNQIHQYDLDEMVADCKMAEASMINNMGGQEQIEYLKSNGILSIDVEYVVVDDWNKDDG